MYCLFKPRRIRMVALIALATGAGGFLSRTECGRPIEEEGPS